MKYQHIESCGKMRIFRTYIRILFLSLSLLTSVSLFGVGWTPTDCGLVVNFSPGDQFLLSVWIDANSNGVEDAGEEYFVCDYPTYSGGRFSYAAGNTLKLVPQAPGATNPSAASVWTVDTALTRISGNTNYSLGGISYTMWGNSGNTLMTGTDKSANAFKFLGSLTNNKAHTNLCDVIFAVPTNRSTDADPNHTLGHAGAFDGQMGTGFAGMTYREVYMFDIPRSNTPNTYVNASLVTFNTTSSTKKWNGENVSPGRVYYAFADAKHNPTTRTLFRMYVLNKPFSSCSSYFFGWDTQDYKRYRQSNTMTDYTNHRKIYTLDHFECMTHEGGESKIFKTDGMQVPESDSTYFYVGKNNSYYAAAAGTTLGPGANSYSQFTKIRQLRVDALKDADATFSPAAGAHGRMVVDTTAGGDNMGVTFEPTGYFFKTSSGVNVPMKKVNDSTWITEQMWYIAGEYMSLSGIVLLYTGEQFSVTDPGAEIIGWSESVAATSIPVYGQSGTAEGRSGWARIHTNRTAKNGGIEFVIADSSRCVIYDYNGLIGTPIPNGYPSFGGNKVQIQDAQLKAGFTFLGWATAADGDVEYWPKGTEGKTKFIGDSVTLAEKDTLRLYAKGTFNDTYRVAFSFIEGGKRYFITHPNSSAPRFARARTFTDWTNVYQGMSDAENREPNYISTYKMIDYPTCELCERDPDKEVVLDPQHETVRGVVDSLTFYEYWTPATDEFLGLYYEPSINTLIANNTWAGAFKSTKGWPAYNRTAVDNTKLYSDAYFTGMLDEESISKKYRRTDQEDPATALPAYIQYDQVTNQFNGVAESAATEFQITGIAVADAHYIILPDTADESAVWVDSITFDYHTSAQEQLAWSKLIGKQLMACLRVGPDTVYFHPNRKKTITDYNDLRLSLDYRMTQDFSLIRDRRAAGLIAEGDSVSIEETANGFNTKIISGATSPIGPEFDIVDTLRVTMRPARTTKIKDYYGRWKNGASGLHINADGSRYRDILIKTKAYHYGDTKTELVLKPKAKSYSFGALENNQLSLQFTLTKITYRELLDVNDEVMFKDTIATKDTTDVFTTIPMNPGWCSIKTDAYFTKVAADADYVTIKTKGDNSSGSAYIDTLTVTIPANTFTGYTEAITVKVPLIQGSMQGTELVWSVVHNSKRYFILGKADGLVFREYSLRNNTLYQYSTSNALYKGAANAANNNTRYITPWTFAYPDKAGHPNQLTLKAETPINKYFAVSGDDGTTGDAATVLTFDIVRSNANDNANYEEIVRLKVVDKWVKFTGSKLELTSTESEASTFCWGYLLQEYNLLNNGEYPSATELAFDYNNPTAKSVQTPYKAYREYSMLLDNSLTYLCREQEADYADLVDGTKDWKTTYTTTLVRDARDFDGTPKPTSELTKSTTNFVTTITPDATSPMDVKIDGKYVNIVDTLEVTLATSRIDYRFKDWKNVSSISDACLKIPLIRTTYHNAPYDSLVCAMGKEEFNFAFPSALREGVQEDSLKTFHFETLRRRGTNVLDVDNNVVSHTTSKTDTLTGFDLSSPALAEIRLVDEYGKTPGWCQIEAKGTNTVTVRCNSSGIRSPRTAYLYFAYIVTYDEDKTTFTKYVNFKFTVSQSSLFQYANNQTLIHSPGASGDPLMADGRQQAHEHKRILYYYNPEPYGEADQNVELPIRERDFYGWWRWYQENEGVEDTDIPDSVWITKPRNTGKFNFPYRIIGDSVDDPENPGKKKLVTMGRYTVFHYPSRDYADKKDPPAKVPYVMAPWRKDTVTYVVDISNYYDNLPLSMSHINQIDTALLDTMRNIIEPTLSLRESFELHPWTEMAERLDTFKYTAGTAWKDQKYMEDHVVMAPTGNRLLLTTEQRYSGDHLLATGHSESLLGYYMRDDHWSDVGWSAGRKDTMIWCGGWDVDCEWYTYTPSSGYTKCAHTVTQADDFLDVPAKSGITAGKDADTVYYCLRAQSQSTTGTPGVDEETVDGDYWFNICRYMIIYHRPAKYGPLEENGTGTAAKAIITNDEIEQNYEVLERLNFDYVQPGKDYHVYSHPLPWADASYGYSYPVGPEIPDNRYHNDFAPNFPGPGEYGLINRIPTEQFSATYWYPTEQHGGAENGYMIYCDGMSSAGQVAALTLKAQLCKGQKMYFSGYIGNVSNQSGKSNPNFTFTVQGSDDGETWSDITSYMTGDIKPSRKWYQIYFPIDQKETFGHYRVKIFNIASDFDGNDFVIDDLCIFATKPPLIAYQANTACVASEDNDSITQVLLRMDYQGFVDSIYNNTPVYYTVEQIKDKDTSFVALEDGYFYPDTIKTVDEKKDSVYYGHIQMPAHSYVPLDEDSIFANMNLLVTKFEESVLAKEEDPSLELFRQGYIYERLDGVERPVLYVLHLAKMAADITYNVRMSLDPGDLMISECAMTSNLKVTDHMMLELNGEEQTEKEITGMCANTTYDLSVRVKGSLYNDSTAPIELNGSCVNDWLFFGDTADATSVIKYGYKYSDIRKVITSIFRNSDEANRNRFVSTLAAINKNDLIKYSEGVILSDGVDAYELLDSMVSKGFLLLYQSKITATVANDDSVQFVVFPIEGTGTDIIYQLNMEVCPTPMYIKLKSAAKGVTPMIVGGIQRDSTQANLPIVVLANARTANDQLTLRIDSLVNNVAIHSISLLSSDDPNCNVGVHMLNLEPDRIYNFGGDNSGYYKKGDDMLLSPSPSNNYQMRQGYNYTFSIILQTLTGSTTTEEGCPVGTIPFTVSVVPDYLRWAPQSKDNNKWNDPNNWIGVDANNQPIHENAHFAPIASTDVIIPNLLPEGLPYPELPDPNRISSTDSVKQVGFVYNTCDDIRFLPGAAISQQQRLTCDVAVVDMIIPHNKWALRAAPVAGMLSGDLFMADADLNGETGTWSVGPFDASGRASTTGNASFWLSLYNNTTVQINNGAKNDTTHSESAEWSKVTNGMTLSLPPASGFAVYARTASGSAADIRLPKNDDRFYYYDREGERLDDMYENNLRALRTTYAGGSGAGKLAFRPGLEATSQAYTISNTVASTSFVFGNPTIGYIDIWGFIADNNTYLKEEIDYMDDSGYHTAVTRESAEGVKSQDTITNLWRYLPPMHAMVVKLKTGVDARASLPVTLNTSRIVTKPSQKAVRPSAPRRSYNHQVPKGIMTVTAVNPVSTRCVSRLLIGQGYHSDIRSGEDAVLTTLNIDKFHMTNTPTTPFNIYAAEKGYGLSIDLMDSVVNVPISFYMSDLPYEPVTQLWFTGVNSIDGSLVLYDAKTDTERAIIDGICLNIETPEQNHEIRYYIRRRGYKPDSGSDPVTTGSEMFDTDGEQAVKIIENGHVLIIRNGHVYTTFGQKLK